MNLRTGEVYPLPERVEVPHESTPLRLAKWAWANWNELPPVTKLISDVDLGEPMSIDGVDPPVGLKAAVKGMIRDQHPVQIDSRDLCDGLVLRSGPILVVRDRPSVDGGDDG